MKTLVLLFLFVINISSCASKKEFIELKNGYRLWSMNPEEIYIAQPDHELIVGPRLTRLGISGDLLVAFCTDETVIVNGFANTSGYSIVDTQSGELERGLSYAQLTDRLTALGVLDVKMEDVSHYFRQPSPEERVN